MTWHFPLKTCVTQLPGTVPRAQASSKQAIAPSFGRPTSPSTCSKRPTPCALSFSSASAFKHHLNRPLPIIFDHYFQAVSSHSRASPPTAPCISPHRARLAYPRRGDSCPATRPCRSRRSRSGAVLVSHGARPSESPGGHAFTRALCESSIAIVTYEYTIIQLYI